jgi:hypothetical protein
MLEAFINFISDHKFLTWKRKAYLAEWTRNILQKMNVDGPTTIFHDSRRWFIQSFQVKNHTWTQNCFQWFWSYGYLKYSPCLKQKSHLWAHENPHWTANCNIQYITTIVFLAMIHLFNTQWWTMSRNKIDVLYTIITNF